METKTTETTDPFDGTKTTTTTTEAPVDVRPIDQYGNRPVTNAPVETVTTETTIIEKPSTAEWSDLTTCPNGHTAEVHKGLASGTLSRKVWGMHCLKCDASWTAIET